MLLFFFSFCIGKSKLTDIEEKNLRFGIVIFISGQPKKVFPDGTEINLVPGMTFSKGDTLVTPYKARVDVQFYNGYHFRIISHSSLSLESFIFDSSGLWKICLVLNKGKIFLEKASDISTQDSVETKVSTMVFSGLGNQYILEKKKDSILLKVTDGDVLISQFQNAKVNQLQSIKQGFESEMKFISRSDNAEIYDLEIRKTNYTHKDKFESLALTSIKDEQWKKLALKIEQRKTFFGNLLDNGLYRDAGLISLSLGENQVYKTKIFAKDYLKNVKTFANTKDMKSYYQRWERLKLADGSFVEGALILRDNGILWIHTESGVRTFNETDVKEFEHEYQLSK